MSELMSGLITSEMMNNGVEPDLFTGGACNIQSPTGPIRNPGRDQLALWLAAKGWSYFDPQIHPSTHGREYDWLLDGPQERGARQRARLRIYEITATTIGAVSMMEIMDDARCGRQSIVWFNEGRKFAPIGLGEQDVLVQNEALRQEVGEMVYSHLVAYVNAGRLLRNELVILLADAPHIVFVDSYIDLQAAIASRLAAPNDPAAGGKDENE